jgi:hypothetical protein
MSKKCVFCHGVTAEKFFRRLPRKWFRKQMAAFICGDCGREGVGVVTVRAHGGYVRDYYGECPYCSAQNWLERDYKF